MSLIAWYKLDGNALDSSGNGRDGATVGTPNVAAGKIGSSYSFDYGSDDGISIPDNKFPLYDFTMTAWIKPAGTHYHYDAAIISSGNWNSTHWSFGVNQSNTGLSCRNPRAVGVYTFTLNTWHFVVYRREGTNLKLYANNTLVYNGTATTHIPLSSDATNTCIGRETYAGGYFGFNGSIDDVRIYDHALSEEEVKELSRAKVLHYDFDQDVGADGLVVDKSGYDNHAELTPSTAPQWVEDSVLGAGAYGFKITGKKIEIPNNIIYKDGITLSAWIKPDSVGIGNSYGRVLDKSTNTGFANGVVVGVASGSYRFGVNEEKILSAPGRPYLRWVHIGISIDKEGNYLFLEDGILISQGKTNPPSQIIAGTPMTIGNRSGSTDRTFDGTIDDVRIYATALNADDILSLYQSRGRLDNKGNLFLHNINQPAVVTDGLVGWWPLAGDTKDYSGFNNDGVNNGAASTTGVTGEADTAYSFDGNDQILCGDGSSLNVSNFTLSSWIKTADATTDYNHILSKGETGSTIHMHYILYIRSGVARVLFGNGVSTNSVNIGSVSNDSWHLVTGIYDGTYLKGYLDGVLTNTFTCTLTPAQKPTKQLAIGTNGVSGETYTGLIQDVRIYNRALTEGEIQLLYKEGLNLL